MAGKDKLVDLGFAGAKMPVGTHICQIYSDDSERDESLMQFLLAGLQLGECDACYSENVSREKLESFFAEHGVSFAEATASGALTLAPTRKVYFENDRFDPERLLAQLASYQEAAVKAGYNGARVIGEMTADIEHVEGGSRLFEYEARVSVLLRDHPMTAVCQYDARAFDGATIMDVLKVHPMMIVHGALVHNPYFIPPEEFLDRTH